MRINNSCLKTILTKSKANTKSNILMNNAFKDSKARQGTESLSVVRPLPNKNKSNDNKNNLRLVLHILSLLRTHIIIVQ